MSNVDHKYSLHCFSVGEISHLFLSCNMNLVILHRPQSVGRPKQRASFIQMANEVKALMRSNHDHREQHRSMIISNQSEGFPGVTL